MWHKVKLFLDMIKISHSVFALPFAFISAILAWTLPTLEANANRFDWLHLLGILICMVSARSAAMAFNRIVDRDIDGRNPRTKSRHIPAGLLSVQASVVFLILTSLIFVGGTFLFLPNPLPPLLSLPVLAFLCAYSLTKRFTNLAHFWLGLSLSLAPVATWIAIRGSEVWGNPFDLLPAVTIGVAVFFWVAGFDMIYACQDFEFDRDNGLQSIPATLGIAGALRLAATCHFIMILVLFIVPYSEFMPTGQLGLGWIYTSGVVILAGLIVSQHFLVSPTNLTKVNIAFFNVNAAVSLGLLFIVAVDVLWI